MPIETPTHRSQLHRRNGDSRTSIVWSCCNNVVATCDEDANGGVAGVEAPRLADIQEGSSGIMALKSAAVGSADPVPRYPIAGGQEPQPHRCRIAGQFASLHWTLAGSLALLHCRGSA
ncbi:unnamed protein product [Phytophthora fragariaefolia]|uniref:Unnamed protein product n=1 Tax=Phytophthora fragariaefolia TaxID=1490495 RepID=A0A9W7CQI9_9STRA|nr:unnamed protein product [Phytophthora fragariaefolia]